MKNFDEWNEVKKDMDKKEKISFCHIREIWWVSLGLNIGTEIDGKNTSYERPVLIYRKFNRKSILVLPITTKIKKDRFHFSTYSGKGEVCIKLTQIRTIDTKRLLRKIGFIKNKEFLTLESLIKEII